jgi:hypothetical protein
MNFLLKLALVLCLWAQVYETPKALAGGSTIIFHSHYTVDLLDDCNTLVIVTSELEITTLKKKIRSAIKPLYFVLEGTDDKMWLQPISDGRLGGRFIDSRRRVVVVSKAYAERNGLK